MIGPRPSDDGATGRLWQNAEFGAAARLLAPRRGRGLLDEGPELPVGGAWAHDAPRASDFVRMIAGGFGDNQNSYAFSMAWFEGDLYVGTVRNMLALIDFAPPPLPTNLEPWPVETPRDLYSLDNRAQIWRYRAAHARWEEVYRSPVIERIGGAPAPRDIGYRFMEVFQARGDRKPALYVAAASSASRGAGAHILRYTNEDGVTVSCEPVLGDREISTLRVLKGFNAVMFMGPAGKGRAWNATERPVVYASRDPLGSQWEPISEPGFGDPTNEAIYNMVVFRDRLYVGTLNSVTGFQLWKSGLDPTDPRDWVRIISQGAGRGNLNQGAVSMAVFQDALFIGTGISNGGRDRTHGIGPAAAELIKVYPDDSWDLVVGEARRTPQGCKRPVSGKGPGFDSPFAGYFWSMAVHRGWLYVGTFDSVVFSIWGNPKHRPASYRRIDIQRFIEERGGFELWRSRDGIVWHPVTRTGFGNPYNYGARTLLSTPAGIAVGTANPFGPKIAVRLATGWEYVINPKGGCEVWLGRCNGAEQAP